jgi:hypothetical protein
MYYPNVEQEVSKWVSNNFVGLAAKCPVVIQKYYYSH